MGTPDGGPRAYRAVPRTALGGRTAWVVLTVGQFAAVVAVLQRSSLGVATTDALARRRPAGSRRTRRSPVPPPWSATWVIGIVQTLRYRRRTIGALIERDPDAYAALRRGVHLSPPT